MSATRPMLPFSSLLRGHSLLYSITLGYTGLLNLCRKGIGDGRDEGIGDYPSPGLGWRGYGH